MCRHRLPVRALVAVALTFPAAWPIASSAAAPGRQAPSVDAAVQVTGDLAASRGHTIPVLAVDPVHERTIVEAAADAYSSKCSLNISTNGGLSWSPIVAPELPKEYPNCSLVYFGPVVDLAFGKDGTLYYAYSGYNPATYKGRIFLSRSDDLGATWETTMLPWSEPPNIDKGEMGIDGSPSIAVDPHDARRVTVGWGSNWATYTLKPDVLQGKKFYWDVNERVYAAVSGDGGRTFSSPVNVGAGLRVTPEYEGTKPPPQVIAGNDGEIFAFFGEYTQAGNRDSQEGQEGNAPPAHIYQAVSRDGGRTYTESTIFTGPPPTTTFDMTWVPRAGIDRRTGTLYVAWENLSSTGGPVQISVITSTDNGKAWSEPKKVNDVDQPRKWNYSEAFPQMSVAPNGRVDVAWYDSRNDPTFVGGDKDTDNKYQDVYYTFSLDGGRTWAPNVKVNDRLIDRRFGPSGQGQVRGPVGVVSLDSAAFIAWDDSRNGNSTNASQDIYFTRARFGGGREVFAPDEKATSGLVWALAGSGITLAVAGLVLVVSFGAARRRDPRHPAATPGGLTAPG